MPPAGRRVIVCSLVTLLWAVTGCQPLSRSVEREASDVPLFAPTDLRLHPFTSIKDWTGDGRVDGLEVLLELQDRFRDPTKATGSVLFELYGFRRNFPDPRGDRVAAWRGSLLTLEEQRAHWNRISRTYSFQLASADVRGDRSYVLQVWFDQQGGRRLTAQVVLEPQQEAPGGTPADIPVTRPVLTPVTGPATQPQPPVGQPTPRTPEP